MVVGFDGIFHSGGIMTPFHQKLSIMPDKSLGFEHPIEEKNGYALYNKTHSYVHGNIQMNLGGLQSEGSIEHQTTEVESDRFVFYPDKVSAEIKTGRMRPGSVSGLENTSYPEVEFEKVKLFWQPNKDNFLLKTKGVPISIRKGLAKFEGTFNVRSTGAFGSGELRSSMVRTESAYLHFMEKEYTGRQANFEVLSADPKKPAMRGKRIQIRYDIEKNIGYMHAERPGLPSFDFPYVQMKTSMYDAVWDHDKRRVEMTHPEGADPSESVFISTAPKSEGLSFQGLKATYVMDSSLLRVDGVPYVRVLGVDIIPEKKRIVVEENANIVRLRNATLHIDFETQYHTLINGSIKIHSANSFSGSADYRYVNLDADTFLIKFNEFFLESVRGDDKQIQEVVTSSGDIPEEQKFKASAGFYFKGGVKMYSNKKTLRFDGYVKLALDQENDSLQWIKYKSDPKEQAIYLDFDKGKTENGTPLSAGLHHRQDGQLYMTFMQNKEEQEDTDLFEPKGVLSYDEAQNFYLVEDVEKKEKEPEKEKKKKKKPTIDFSSELNIQRQAFSYSPRTGDIIFRGPLSILEDDKHVDVLAAASGKMKLQPKSSIMEGLMAFDFDLPKKVSEAMGEQMEGIRQYLSLTQAGRAEEFADWLAFVIGERDALDYLAESSNPPLYEASSRLRTDLVFSRVRLRWDVQQKRWYSSGTLQLANTKTTNMDVELKGYLQIQPRAEGTSLDLLLYFSPTLWYHISYRDENLQLYSGITEMNDLVKDISRNQSPVLGDYSFTLGRAWLSDAFVTSFTSNAENTMALDMKYPDPVLKPSGTKNPYRSSRNND